VTRTPTPNRRALLAICLAVVGSSAVVGCAAQASPSTWTGGPASPAPVRITINPSAPPLGNTVPTGIVVQDREMILYFWGNPANPYFDVVWRDRGTGQVTEKGSGLGVGARPPDGFFEVNQLVAEDGTLIEYGALRRPAARITCAADGVTVEARYTRWSIDPMVTIFWLQRSGSPIPANRDVGDGRTEPLEPERYPLLTAYDSAGQVIATIRIRPEATQQKGG